MSLNSLPDDVLIEIFMRVPATIVCKTLELVCKRWHNLIETELFWIEKGFRDRRINQTIIKAFQERGFFEPKK